MALRAKPLIKTLITGSVGIPGIGLSKVYLLEFAVVEKEAAPKLRVLVWKKGEAVARKLNLRDLQPRAKSLTLTRNLKADCDVGER